jgi:S-sulfo-L-cysteine synthase (O-acetyl-L-serine-dependent)
MISTRTPCEVPATVEGHAPPPIEQLGRDSVNILGYIGNTPLLCLGNLTRHLKKVRVFAKAEYLNPGGSVKDRAALNMILHGEATGELTRDKTILDSTSGNTGIAYAMIGAARGYKVKLVMPGNVSPERKNIVRLYGADVVLSSPFEGSDGAIVMARQIYDENPNAYFKPDQYNNELNPIAHYKGTGPEIWRQTNGRVTHFLATIGTSGTLMGTGRYLKEQNPDVQIVAVEPDNPMHGIEGLKHMESSIKPGIYHESAHDFKIPAATEDAYDMSTRLAREEGIFVGFSAGAAVWAAIDLAEKLEAEGREATIVTILCDRGDRYLTLLSQQWANDVSI